LSSKMSSCQGVSFQSISRRGNLGLDKEESGTYAPDDSAPFNTCSSCTWSSTRSSSAPPGITLMGLTSMTGEEVDAPISPTTPCAPASAPGGEVVAPASAAGGGVAVLESTAGGGVVVLMSSTSVCTATTWSGDLVREGEA
jgi:hypothetical protein